MEHYDGLYAKLIEYETAVGCDDELTIATPLANLADERVEVGKRQVVFSLFN